MAIWLLIYLLLLLRLASARESNQLSQSYHGGQRFQGCDEEQALREPLDERDFAPCRHRASGRRGVSHLFAQCGRVAAMHRVRARGDSSARIFRDIFCFTLRRVSGRGRVAPSLEFLDYIRTFTPRRRTQVTHSASNDRPTFALPISPRRVSTL